MPCIGTRVRCVGGAHLSWVSLLRAAAAAVAAVGTSAGRSGIVKFPLQSKLFSGLTTAFDVRHVMYVLYIVHHSMYMKDMRRCYASTHIVTLINITYVRVRST